MIKLVIGGVIGVVVISVIAIDTVIINVITMSFATSNILIAMPLYISTFKDVSVSVTTSKTTVTLIITMISSNTGIGVGVIITIRVGISRSTSMGNASVIDPGHAIGIADDTRIAGNIGITGSMARKTTQVIDDTGNTDGLDTTGNVNVLYEILATVVVDLEMWITASVAIIGGTSVIGVVGMCIGLTGTAGIADMAGMIARTGIAGITGITGVTSITGIACILDNICHRYSAR